jgi:DNA-binding NarL/FixJ family response regulator
MSDRQNKRLMDVMVKKKISVFLIDDHPLVLEGLKKLIESDERMSVLGTASSASAGMTAIEKVKPDVVIVDLSLNDMSGIDLIKTLRSRLPGIKPCVLSMHDENIYADRALRAGAFGYVMKHVSVEKIIEAIMTVNNGDIFLSDAMKNKLIGRISRKSHDGELLPEECLTDREIIVFQMIGEGKKTREIAAHLGLSSKTVDAHREHIKAKLGIASSHELVMKAIHWVEKSL